MDPRAATAPPRLLGDAVRLGVTQSVVVLGAVAAQALILGQVGLLVPAGVLFAATWLWFRGRVQHGLFERSHVRALAVRAGAVQGALAATAYAVHGMVMPEALPDPKALPLGCVAVGVFGALTAAGLTLCAGDTARATGAADLPVAPRHGGRPAGQRLSPADEGLGPGG